MKCGHEVYRTTSLHRVASTAREKDSVSPVQGRCRHENVIGHDDIGAVLCRSCFKKAKYYTFVELCVAEKVSKK